MLAWAGVGLPLAANAGAELRVLIDVSGSMAQNDPRNLRQAAATLVVGLLPDDARAGLWMFATEATPLIAPASPGPVFRAAAESGIRRIHSRGRFTDIEAAIEAATLDWRGAPAAGAERALVLLTDGMVDLAAGLAASAASRTRILGALAAELAANDVVVHTVALSDAADRPLLEELAAATNGRFERTADATELNRTFLRMFEHSVERDAVPLIGNAFQIDERISEFTLLAFHGKAGRAITLRAPDGAVMNFDAQDEDVRWRREAGYDLVTVRTPEAGTWRLEGAADPDNRVMIVTDLALASEALPASMLDDETIEVRFQLTEKNEPIRRADFLELVDAAVEVRHVPQATTERAPEDVPRTALPAFHASDGTFAARVPAPGVPGELDLTIRTDGGTFQRILRRRITLIGNPLELTLASNEEGEARVAVRVAGEADLLAPGSMRVVTAATRPDGTLSLAMTAPDDPEAGGLDIEFTMPGTHRVSALALATTRRGRVVHAERGPLAVTVESEPDPVPAASDPLTAKPDPVRMGMVLGPANLLMLAGLLYFRRHTAAPAVRRRRSRAPADRAETPGNEKLSGARGSANEAAGEEREVEQTDGSVGTTSADDASISGAAASAEGEAAEIDPMTAGHTAGGERDA